MFEPTRSVRSFLFSTLIGRARAAGSVRAMVSGAVLTALAWSSGVAQQPATVPAVYTDAQARAGEQLYEGACAACHLSNLQGSFEAPALTGPNFRNRWSDLPVSELVRVTQERMPPGAAGSFTNEEYTSVVAYLLRESGLPAGNVALSATAAEIAFVGAGDSPPAGAPAAILYPEPGRLGNAPSPFSFRLGVRRTVGEVHETPTAITRTLREATGFNPVTTAELIDPPARDWLHWRGNPLSWGYSSLDQINRENVDRLRLAWVWGMHPGTNQHAPLVRDGIMYLSNPINIIQALDARDGTLLWEYRRVFPDGRSNEGRQGTGSQLRTLAIWEDLLFVSTRDAHLVALDARDGTVRWETRLADSSFGFTNASGPVVADGIVVNGINGCQQFTEEPCFITGHDARTGQELWRTYTIARPGEPGGDTWGGLPLEFRGGGDVWNGGSWDPALNLVFFGTAQAKPWVAASRGTAEADSTLYTNSTLALDPQSGEIVWYRQHAPGESLDLDTGFEQVLLDLDGRPLLLTGGKDGLLWKLDRRDGSFIGVQETVYQNVWNIDTETGALQYREDITDAQVGQWISVCPSTAGGKNWPAMGYHPGTRLVVLPLSQSCMEISGREVAMELGSGGTAADRAFFAPPDKEGLLGKLAAYDVDSMQEVWSVEQAGAFLTGALTTAGDLVFAGDYDRWIRAYHIRTGEVLWEARLGTAVMGFPMTYEIDGVQYLAVGATRGGGSPSNVPDVLTPELSAPVGANALYVFRLGP